MAGQARPPCANAPVILKTQDKLGAMGDMQANKVIGGNATTNMNACGNGAGVSVVRVDRLKVQRNLFLLLMAFLLPIFGMA